MSRFRSQFKRGPAVSLVRQFGESITYYPLGTGGRSISAIVRRGQEVGPTGVVAQVIVCSVLDDSTLGISATEIDDARDQVLIALEQGGTAERREITLMDDDSNGMVRFRVR
jgi:hypothetical protein